MKKQHQCRWRIYARLLVGMTLVGILIFGVLLKSAVATTQTESGMVTVAATVPGAPPSVASTIDSPTDGTTFTSNPITVKGSCPTDGLIIKITDNGQLVGSAICSGGSYSANIDLFSGQNSLVAQEVDSLNQQGPSSAPVTVIFSPPALLSPAGIPITQANDVVISLSSQYNGYSGCLPGQQFSLPISITGGTPPYAVHIDWGDGSSSLASLKDSAQPLIANHAYAKAGNYQVTVTASDANGQQALFSVVVIINGQPRSLPAKVGHAAQSLWHVQWYYPLIGLFLLFIGFALGKFSKRLSSHS